MNYNLSIAPEVEEDIVAVYCWYEDASIGLGEEFLGMFYTGTRSIQKNPFQCNVIFNDFRRFLLSRFPYALYYLIAGESIIVYGVFHCARNPVFIQDSLDGR